MRRFVGLLAVVAQLIAALASSASASAAESSRDLHRVPTGTFTPDEMVLASDGTPWFTDGSIDDEGQGALHISADGRVVPYDLPGDAISPAWGADGALWAVDQDIGGLVRLTPDGRYTRFRHVWATEKTLLEAKPPNILAGPDGTMWLGDGNRRSIVSVASDGSTRVVVALGGRAEPDLLATGADGSVWFTQVFGTGLRRLLPDGRVEAVRYRDSEIPGASVAPNGDTWFIRSVVDDQGFTLRTYVVRIDRQGHVTEQLPAPIRAASITVAANGTVWIAGDGVARMDAKGRFEQIFRAPRWAWVADILAAPDGRLWLLYGLEPQPTRAGWLPPNPCLSRRQIRLHLRPRRGDPIRSVRVAVQGKIPWSLNGPVESIPIDLRGYLPGTVRVTLTVRTTKRRYVRHRAYRTCTSPN